MVLLKEEHTKFWDIVTEILKALVPEDKWKHTGDRLDGFKNAYGTVRTFGSLSHHMIANVAYRSSFTKTPTQSTIYRRSSPNMVGLPGVSRAIHERQYTDYPKADKFPQWSEHTSAMHQYMLWTAFESEGLGCNLQHYNPLPDERAAAEWKIPLEWSLKAQLVFGEPQEGAREGLAEKSRKPVEDRLKIYGM